MQTTKKILILVISIFISISLTACGNGLTDRQLTKILKENGYTPNKAKVLSVVDCPSNMEGLENGNNKFVLTSDTVNGTTNHAFCIIDTDTRHITDIPFQYTPLNFVQQGIWLKDNITNMNCFNIARKYIEKYGVNAFTDKDHAEEYLRELTKNNHVINTVEAQDIINNSVTQIFPKITSPDDVTVFYEDNSAVPLYYATESTDMVYNWNGIFDESVYKVWAASTDRESQSIMQAMYGSPYVMKECVAVVDSNMNQIGTFKSMDEAKAQLKGKKSSSNNTTQNKASNQATNNTSENSNNKEDLYRSSLTYQRMEDIHNSKLTDDNTHNEIVKVINDFNNKCENYMNNGNADVFLYLKSNSIAYQQQTEYKEKHSTLTQHYTDIYVKTTRQSNEYYYVWVEEHLTQTENNSTKNIESNWVYKMYKSDGQWYIDDYTQDPLCD